MRKRIGIVIEKWDDGKMNGYLAETEVNLVINDNSLIEVKEVVFEKHFIYDTKSLMLVPDVLIDWETAKDIGRELIKIGFKNFRLLFQDKLYYFNNEFDVQQCYKS